MISYLLPFFIDRLADNGKIHHYSSKNKLFVNAKKL
jgi:hypothetical protein